jgi:hypothetical protein
MNEVLSAVDQELIAEQVYEAYRLGRIARGIDHLPMWHEPASRRHLPQVEIRRALDVVEGIVAEAKVTAVCDARDEIERMLDGFPQHGRHTRARWAVVWLGHIIERLTGLTPGAPS